MPSWLGQAYENPGFELDVGMADRSISTALTKVGLAWRMGINPAEPCLDWGAGTGLMVRICRDFGLNYFYSDPHSQNIFARGFEAPTAGSNPVWACVTAFEVAEHFASPLEDFGEILKLSPRFLLFSTTLYAGQSADWWYFGENGQHVAFYTRKSLEFVARHYHYHLATNGSDLHLFAKEDVSDRALKKCAEYRDRFSRRYKRKHGSRTFPDFENIRRKLRARAGLPV
jgi:hypothetical protein